MQLVLRVGGIYMADDGLIGAVTSHGLNVQFAVQGNLEGENMLAGLLAYLVAVYIQGNSALVGINLYGSVLPVRSTKRLEQMCTKASSLHHALYR